MKYKIDLIKENTQQKKISKASYSENLKSINHKESQGQQMIFWLFFFCFDKIRFDISCESLARQMIHMKCQTLLYPKKKNENVLYYNCAWGFY